MNILARTKSVDATRDLGAAIAELARPGDLMLLAGDLGAGKTAFTQGFGAALGVREPITSPTFTLARQYRGRRLLLNHLDVYRLEQIEEVYDLGLPEMLDEGAVTLIEWGDAILPAVPADFLEVRLTFVDSDDDRNVTIRPVGPSWGARTGALRNAVAQWTDEGIGPC
jgi:tRNA threonylcarbamoyladenosine biosynthesis protein TsaE